MGLFVGVEEVLSHGFCLTGEIQKNYKNPTWLHLCPGPGRVQAQPESYQDHLSAVGVVDPVLDDYEVSNVIKIMLMFSRRYIWGVPAFSDASEVLFKQIHLENMDIVCNYVC